MKATVSNRSTVFYNLRTMALDMPAPYQRNLFNNEINGIFIMPIGKFVCMLVKKNGGNSMVLLDLIGKDELAEKMAEKLNNVGLKDEFMNVYAEIVSHPEKQGRFKLVVGEALSR